MTQKLSAQDSRKLDFQTWSDLTTGYFFNQRLIYSGDYGIRGVLSGQDWYTFYVRPTFRYNLKSNVNIRAGAAIFFTRDPVIMNQLEIRFHQEVDLKWPQVVGFAFGHMIRFEERIFNYKEMESERSVRGRYRLSIESPDFKVFLMKNPFYAMVNGEIFIPLGAQSTERYINNNRIVAGIGHRLSGKFRYELHYIFQRSRNYSHEDLKGSEHILRLRTFLTLNPPVE